MEAQNDTARLLAIDQLAARLAVMTGKDASLAACLGGVPNDLARIKAGLVADPESWRLCRAFHLVHVPSLDAALRLYADLDPAIGTQAREPILTSLARAAQLFSAARAQMADSALRRATIEAEVLAERAPPRPEETRASGIWGRVSRMGSEAIDAAGGAASYAWRDISARASGLQRLGLNMGGVLGAILRENVSGPISVRLSASGRALEAGLSGGIGAGVVIGILFPPLLPLAAAGGVLDALDAYRKGVKEFDAIETLDQEMRRSELARERTMALRDLAGGASTLQMETGLISLSLNAETGETDALIINGPMAGRSWSGLNAEQRRALRAEAKGDDIPLLDILTIGILSAAS